MGSAGFKGIGIRVLHLRQESMQAASDPGCAERHPSLHPSSHNCEMNKYMSCIRIDECNNEQMISALTWSKSTPQVRGKENFYQPPGMCRRVEGPECALTGGEGDYATPCVGPAVTPPPA